MTEADSGVMGRSIYKQLARGAGAVFVVHVAGTALGLVGQVLLAHWLGVADYGSFVYIHSWSILLGNIAGLGLTPAILRFLPSYAARGQGRRYRAYLANAGRWSLATSVLLGVGIWLLASKGYLGRYGDVWRIGVWLVPAYAILNLHMQEGRAQGRVILAMAPQNLLMHASMLLGAGLLLTVRGSIDARGALAAFAAGLLLVALVQGILLRRTRPVLPAGEDAAGLLGEWFRVGMPLFLVLVFMYLLTKTDMLLVGAMLGQEAVGIYSAASKMAATVTFAFFAVNSAGAPMIAALFASGDADGLKRMVRRTSRWIFWPSLAIAGGLMILGKPILSLFPNEFLAAYGDMLILCAGYLAMGSMGLAASLLNLTGNERWSAFIYGGTVALNLVLNLVLIPRLGSQGAALSTAIAMLVLTLSFCLVARRRLGIDPFIFGRDAVAEPGHE